jgi:hypothetical protein
MVSVSNKQSEDISIKEIKNSFISEICFINHWRRLVEANPDKTDKYLSKRKRLISRLDNVVKPISQDLYEELHSMFD